MDERQLTNLIKQEGHGVILRDGQSLFVRPIRPDDRKMIEELFYRLSPQTRYLRYMYQKEMISEQEISAITESTPPETASWVATMGQAEEERIVAIANWFRIASGSTAEVAFLVEDKIQLKGIGTALLERMAESALKYKMRKFVASVLPQNTRMLEVFLESGFIVEKRLDEGVYHIEIDLLEQEEFSRRQAYREHIARSAGVRRLLQPMTVAVVGASRNAQSVGGAVFRNLLHGGFQGTVFPVNPKTSSVAGVMSYPSVMEIPADVDLAVIVVPAAIVPDVADQCGRKGVEALVVISAGFAEAGKEGRELQRKLRDTVLSYGMRMVGPNCLGIINTDSAISMNATFSPIAAPMPGNIGLGSHSGALGLALLEYAEKNGLGIRSFASIGNRVDISSNDMLEYWEDDDQTRVIALYLESFGNPRKFSRIARRVSRKKPIIAVKAGKSAVGAKAATSHTGALAAADVAVEALFKQAGVIRVVTIQEMFNVLRLMANQPVPEGKRVGILTNAGGPGVLAADACEGWGLEVPTLGESTQAALRTFLPPEAAISNPVDMVASARPASYGKALRLMLDDPALDAVIIIYIPPLVTKPEDVAREVRTAMSGYDGGKTVLACFMMQTEKGVDLAIEGGGTIPSFVFPEDAVQALARAHQYSERRMREAGVPVRFPDIDEDNIRTRFLPQLPLGDEGKWLEPELAAQMLQAFGIHTVETRTAMNAEEAAASAAEIGYPIVMKLRSSTIVHKSDINAVELGLQSSEEVRDAFTRMERSLEARGLRQQMEGVILQPMIQGGHELILGMATDPVFGPLIMLGTGGTQVEVMKDIAFYIHPLTDKDPQRMIDDLKGKRLLEAWRGKPARDLSALKETMLRFSAMIEAFPEIVDAEINPIVVMQESAGCMALDFRMLVKAQAKDL